MRISSPPSLSPSPPKRTTIALPPNPPKPQRRSRPLAPKSLASAKRSARRAGPLRLLYQAVLRSVRAHQRLLQLRRERRAVAAAPAASALPPGAPAAAPSRASTPSPSNSSPPTARPAPCPAHAAHPAAQLRVSAESLLRAKRTLLAEGRYSCCIRGRLRPVRPRNLLPVRRRSRQPTKASAANAWMAGAPGAAPSPPSTPPKSRSPSFGGWAARRQRPALRRLLRPVRPARARQDLLHQLGHAQRRAAAPDPARSPSLHAQRRARHHHRQALPAALRHRRDRQRHPHHQRPAPSRFLHGACGALQNRPVGERTAIHFYGGPRGEPALGPPAYPHRASASENPVAPISHHLQDSTHIATNVVTAGITYGPLTWEVSGFHGREPDELRWGIEGGAIDSLSTRLTVTPHERWSGQFSARPPQPRRGHAPPAPGAAHHRQPHLRAPASPRRLGHAQRSGAATTISLTPSCPDFPVLPHAGLRPGTLSAFLPAFPARSTTRSCWNPRCTRAQLVLDARGKRRQGFHAVLRRIALRAADRRSSAWRACRPTPRATSATSASTPARAPSSRSFTPRRC